MLNCIRFEGVNGDEVIAILNQSVSNMVGKIDGLLSAEIGWNVADSDYDFVYCADLRDEQALVAYQAHPLHQAHKRSLRPT